MNNFKSILWTILGIVIFIAIVKFFISILPFVIIIGIIGYIAFKFKYNFNNKEKHKKYYDYYDKNSNNFEENNIDYGSNNKIIDVDYKEVDK